MQLQRAPPMSAGSIWSGQRRVMAAEAENPAASSPGGAPSGQILTGGLYSGAQAGSRIEPEILYKIVIVGDSGVGKSCLLVRFTDDKYEDQVSTIGTDFRFRDISVGQGSQVRMQLWDTAGQERYRSQMSAYYRGAHGIVLTYSVDDKKSFENIPRWIADVDKFAGPGCAKLLVGNKADVDEKTQRQVHYDDAQVRASRQTLAAACSPHMSRFMTRVDV